MTPMDWAAVACITATHVDHLPAVATRAAWYNYPLQGIWIAISSCVRHIFRAIANAFKQTACFVVIHWQVTLLLIIAPTLAVAAWIHDPEIYAKGAAHAVEAYAAAKPVVLHAAKQTQKTLAALAKDITDVDVHLPSIDFDARAYVEWIREWLAHVVKSARGPHGGPANMASLSRSVLWG